MAWTWSKFDQKNGYFGPENSYFGPENSQLNYWSKNILSLNVLIYNLIRLQIKK